MAHVVQTMAQMHPMLSASRAIVLVSVPWSPWPRKSRDMLAALESTLGHWSRGPAVGFFDLWPECDGELNRWYEVLCANSSPQFELHGHGYGPLWWLAEGEVLDCLSRPYEYTLESLQQRSAGLFEATIGIAARSAAADPPRERSSGNWSGPMTRAKPGVPASGGSQAF